MHYYKQLDTSGTLTGLCCYALTLPASETQTEISQEEYEAIAASLPAPEPVTDEYKIYYDTMQEVIADGNI